MAHARPEIVVEVESVRGRRIHESCRRGARAAAADELTRARAGLQTKSLPHDADRMVLCPAIMQPGVSAMACNAAMRRAAVVWTPPAARTAIRSSTVVVE